MIGYCHRVPGYCFIAGYLMLKNSRYTTLSCRNNAINLLSCYYNYYNPPRGATDLVIGIFWCKHLYFITVRLCLLLKSVLIFHNVPSIIITVIYDCAWSTTSIIDSYSCLIFFSSFVIQLCCSCFHPIKRQYNFFASCTRLHTHKYILRH